jgi:5'-nucleotidase
VSTPFRNFLILSFNDSSIQTLGNHEFDHGVPGLVPFMERVAPYTPIVSCNIDATLEPTMAPLFNKSVVLNRNGRLIGIVGVTTTIDSDWGKAKVYPEVESVRAEVENLVAQGIKIIIVLSHSGFSVDKEIAKNAGPIDLIVGGHSHSFLYTGSNPVGPDTPVSGYPTIVEQEGGRKVYIVQASAYSKYLGDITLYFGDDGEVKSFEGAPIFLSHDIPQDEEVLQKLIPWQAELSSLQNQLFGKINHQLDANCYTKECGMGNLVADSMAWAVN